MRRKKKPVAQQPQRTPFGIIGGSGTYGFEDYKTQEYSMETPYGRILVEIIHYNGIRVAFVARHGREFRFPPHQTNYRGNIEALSSLGVEYLLATGSVTSLDPGLAPGDAVLLEDFVDFTKNRFCSYHQDGEIVGHVDMDDPYCNHMRSLLRARAGLRSFKLGPDAVYVAIEGPRRETRAETRFYRQMGWQVLGMTTVPEVILAKEKGICYAAVALVTQTSKTLEDGEPADEAALDCRRREIIELFLSLYNEDTLCHDHCGCRLALTTS